MFYVDLLSHFVDPVQSLRPMARLLRPGGILCFEVGTLGGVDERWYRWNGSLTCPDHRWFFSLKGIKNGLHEAGLYMDQSKQFGLVPSMLPLVFDRTFVKPLVQLRRGTGARPWHGEAGEQGQFRKVKGIYAMGQWVGFSLCYRQGPYVPKQGPTTLFITARPN